LRPPPRQRLMASTWAVSAWLALAAAELAFWLLPVLAWFVFPENLSLLTRSDHRAVRALPRPDPRLCRYRSRSARRLLRTRRLRRGLLAKYGYGDPLLGLAAAVALAAAAGFVSSILVLRGSDLTRLMVTLGVSLMLYEAANKRLISPEAWTPAGVEMKPCWAVPLRHDRPHSYVYCLTVLFLLFWVARHLVHSPFGLELRGIRQNALAHARPWRPANRRLVAVYTIGAAYAGVAGALLTQTTQFRLDRCIFLSALRPNFC